MTKIFRSKLPVRAVAACSLPLALILALSASQACLGQNVGFGVGNRVGGVFVDASGMVTPLEKSAKIPLRDALRKMHAAAPAELNPSVEMRMVFSPQGAPELFPAFCLLNQLNESRDGSPHSAPQTFRSGRKEYSSRG